MDRRNQGRARSSSPSRLVDEYSLYDPEFYNAESASEPGYDWEVDEHRNLGQTYVADIPPESRIGSRAGAYRGSDANDATRRTLPMRIDAETWYTSAPSETHTPKTAPSQSSGNVTPSKQPGRGGRWHWDSEHGDYVQERDGKLLKYTEYQVGEMLKAQSTLRPSMALEKHRAGVGDNQTIRDHDHQANDDAGVQLEELKALSLDAKLSQPTPDSQPPRVLRPYETPLDPRFSVVEKPKRFFAVGRIFKTVWFEPGPPQQSSTVNHDVDWSAACPFFHEEKPFAKFKWFVVVRKRLHHSLCFTITTFNGRGATKTSRGRARDFVVLYPAVIEPPDPYPEEGIERDPLAVIIEEGQQFLSPAARVDCGRIYTVEDNLRVMKIGRIHPESLDDLEAYYRESVS